jgi:hypothetical protein
MCSYSLIPAFLTKLTKNQGVEELVYFFRCSWAGVVLGCPLLAAENPVPVSDESCACCEKMICVAMVFVGDL